MNCEAAKNYMMKYFDQDRNEVEDARFMQHLKGCGECSEEFHAMSEIFGALESAETVEPPECFEAMVMKKVNELEAARREFTSRMLVLLYNAATILSIILLMVFVADVRQSSIISAFESIREYFGSFSSILSAVFGVVTGIFRLLAGVLTVIIEVFVSIVKTYYYIFAAMAVLLLAIQRLYAHISTSDRRKS